MVSESKARSGTVVGNVAELTAAIALGAALLHLWGGVRTPLGAAVATAWSRGAWALAAHVERWPALHDASDLRVVLGAALVTALGLAPMLRYARYLEIEAAKSDAARAYEGDRSEPPALVLVWSHLLAVPAVVGLGGVAFWGGALAPRTALLVFGLLAALALTRTGRAAGAVAHPPALPRDLLRRFVPWAAGWAAFLWLHALYVSGPGIEPLPVSEGAWVQWIATTLRDLPDVSWVAPAAQGAAALIALALGGTCLLHGYPLVPRLAAGPAGWVQALLCPAAVAACVGAPVQLLDQWRCPTETGSPIRWIDHQGGGFQLDLTTRELWAVDRRGAETRRYDLADGRLVATVPWGELYGGAQPEEQWVSARGEVWTALVGGHEGEGSTLVVLDAGTGMRTAAPILLTDCYVASVALRNEGRGALLGCENSGEIIQLDLEQRRILERFAVPGAGSVEELIEDPRTGHLYALPLWRGHHLIELDLQRARPVRQRALGDFQWSAALDIERDTLWVPRFQEGQLWRVRLSDLAVDASYRLSYGLRPVVLLGGGSQVVTAATYSGRLWATPADGSQDPRSLHVGGLVRDLALSPDGHALYLAGRCGVGVIDTRQWPGW